MNLTVAVEVALLVAAAAFVLLVGCLIPVVFRAQRQIDGVVLTIVQAKADLDELIGESRELVRNASSLVAHADDRLQDVEEAVGTVRLWKGRVERLASAIGMVAGTALLRVFSHRNHRGESSRRIREGNDHVRT